MTKLYYNPTFCGTASFIAAFTAQVNLQVEQVDIRGSKTSSGDEDEVNPVGDVPILVLDDGTLLNEISAVLQWIADHVCTVSFYSEIFYSFLHRIPVQSLLRMELLADIWFRML